MKLKVDGLKCKSFYKNCVDNISAEEYFNRWVSENDNISIKQIDTVTTGQYHTVTIIVYYYENETDEDFPYDGFMCNHEDL